MPDIIDHYTPREIAGLGRPWRHYVIAKAYRIPRSAIYYTEWLREVKRQFFEASAAAQESHRAWCSCETPWLCGMGVLSAERTGFIDWLEQRYPTPGDSVVGGGYGGLHSTTTSIWTVTFRSSGWREKQNENRRTA